MRFSSPGKQHRTLPHGSRAHTKPLTAKACLFLLAGGAATLVHWVIMGLLVWQGAQAVLATTIGALAGSLINYLLQFYGPFKGSGTHGRAIPAYALTVILGWGVNAGLLSSLILFTQLELGLAQLCTTAVLAAMNFTLYQRIVFHERTRRKLAP